MKKFFALFVLVTLTACLALAQSTLTRPTIKVQVPFAFHIGDKQMPADIYVVQCSGKLISITSHDGAKNLVFMSPSLDTAARTESNALKFRIYGENAFLSEVVFATSERSALVRPSTMELELARQFPAITDAVAGQ